MVCLPEETGGVGVMGTLYGAASGVMVSLFTSLTPQLILGPGMKKALLMKVDGIGKPSGQGPNTNIDVWEVELGIWKTRERERGPR